MRIALIITASLIVLGTSNAQTTSSTQPSATRTQAVGATDPNRIVDCVLPDAHEEQLPLKVCRDRFGLIYK